jgi:hypothetical protein
MKLIILIQILNLTKLQLTSMEGVSFLKISK